MVELVTPRVAPVARQAGQVSRSGSQSLQRAAGVAQGVADQFSEFYEKEAAIENDLLLATAQADWAKTYNERSKGAGNGFAKGMMGDYDTYVSEVMANSPERGRDGLKLAFQKYRLNLESKSLQREASARAAAKNAAVAETHRQQGISLAHEPNRERLAELTEGADRKTQKYLTDVYIQSQIMESPAQVLSELDAGDFDAHLTAAGLMAAQKKAETAAEGAAIATNKAEEGARNERANVLIDRPELLDDMITLDPENEDYYARWAVSGRADSDPEGVMEELNAGKWDGNLTPSQKTSIENKAESTIAKRELEEQEEIRRLNAAQDRAEADEEEALLEAQENRFFALASRAVSASGLTSATINAAVASGDITADMGRSLLNSALEGKATVTDIDVYNSITDLQDAGVDTTSMILENKANLSQSDAKSLILRNSTKNEVSLQDRQDNNLFDFALVAAVAGGVDANGVVMPALDAATISAAVASEDITADMGRSLLNSMAAEPAIETDRQLYSDILKVQDDGSDATSMILSNRANLTAPDALALLRRGSEKASTPPRLSQDATFYRNEVRAAVAPSGMFSVLDQGERDRRYNSVSEFTKRVKEGEVPYQVADDIINRARVGDIRRYDKKLQGLLLPRFSVMQEGAGKQRINAAQSALKLSEARDNGTISEASYLRQRDLTMEWHSIQLELQAIEGSN